jgi:hypothetical protein
MTAFAPRLLLGLSIVNLVFLFGELALQVFGVMFNFH